MISKDPQPRVYASPQTIRRDSPSETQFSPTLSASYNRQHHHHPTHLVVNNFLSSSGGSKSVSTTIVHEGITSCTNTHSNFLYVYFFFGYYLCLTPFRVKRVRRASQSGTFVLHEYFPQKVICGVANLFALIRYGVELRKCVQEVKRENPISFFKLFEASSGFIFKTVILRCFWKNKHKFLEIVNFLHQPHILPYNKFKIECIPTIAGICSFYVIIGFVRMITGDGFLHPSDLSLDWWSRRLVAEAKYSFFLVNESRIDDAPSADEISSLDVFLAVITGLSFQCRFIAGYIVDVGILLSVLSLWAPVTGFSASIHAQLKARDQHNRDVDNGKELVEIVTDKCQNSHRPHENDSRAPVDEELDHQETVMMQYKALKRLTEIITQACGATILPFISEAVFGYAIFFEDVLITRNVVHRIVLVCFYFCAVNILVFSADVCRKMRCMKTWLWDEERFSTFPSQKLVLVLHDLSTNAVGISASGIFTVDFYLVGSMIGVLITLFIIRLQYQTGVDYDS